MNWNVALIVTIIVAVDLVVVGAIFHAVKTQTWGPLVREYPMTNPPADPGKVALAAQLGIWNAGMTFRVTSDEHAVHLTPAWIGSVMRLTPVSIPWDAIDIKKTGKHYTRLKVAKNELSLPTSALAGVLSADPSLPD